MSIVVTKASGTANSFNGTGVLTSNTLALSRQGDTLQCGSRFTRSSFINLGNVHGMYETEDLTKFVVKGLVGFFCMWFWYVAHFVLHYNYCTFPLFYYSPIV